MFAQQEKIKLRSRVFYFLVLFVVVLPFEVYAEDFYVSPLGNDKNPGSKSGPFRTIQKAADILKAGDTCVVRGGTYYETIQPKNSGEKGKPIRFIAAEGEKVTLDGTELIKGQWSVYKGNIYKIKVKTSFHQLFVDGKMMIEARWPNMRFPQQLWDHTTWVGSAKGSRFGKMLAPELAESDIDWTGAVAVLSVGLQYHTRTRRVQGHSRGSDNFTYEADARPPHYPISAYRDYKSTEGHEWEDDRFYLFGKLQALDAPGEWFLDRESKTLYLYTLDGKSPANHDVRVKRRDYTFDVKEKDYVEISGFHFFATTFRFTNCDHCIVESCRLKFPTFAREYIDPSTEMAQAETYVCGNFNTVRKCRIAYSLTNGLVMVGAYNTVENNLIHDVAWTGEGGGIVMINNVTSWLTPGSPVLMIENVAWTAPYCRILRRKVSDPYLLGGCIIRRNTVYNSGHVVLFFGGQKEYVVEYNHFYDASLASRDVAVIETDGREMDGSIIRYNWVHGCNSAKGVTEKTTCKGIRGDDQSQGLTVHHNVVWDIDQYGIIVKGDRNRVFNNTVLGIKSNQFVMLPVNPEPYRLWWEQYPLRPSQNANTLVFNNVTRTIVHRKGAFTESKNVGNNFTGDADPKLVNPAQFDFRPRADSPLIDAGRVITGITDNFMGKAPDIGAYERGGRYWKPGINWSEN